jgi:hypothetical protein
VSIKFDVQSVENSTGDVFNGYMVTILNIQPDISREDDPTGAKSDAMYDKLQKSADKYFKEHPDEWNKLPAFTRRNGYYFLDYMRIKATEFMRGRLESGQATQLEKVYIHQLDNKMGKNEPQMLYCWEQIIGQIPLDASKEEVEAALKKSNTFRAIKEEAQELEESVKRGEASLKNRMAQAQEVRFTLRRKKRDGNTAQVVAESQTTDNRTLNEDEKNYVVSEYIKRKIAKHAE